MRCSNVHSIVLVSDALSNLSISEKWSPVRELGLLLASFQPSSSMEFCDKKQITVAGSQFKLIDEGGVLSRYATKRHLKLDPTLLAILPIFGHPNEMLSIWSDGNARCNAVPNRTN